MEKEPHVEDFHHRRAAEALQGDDPVPRAAEWHAELRGHSGGRSVGLRIHPHRRRVGNWQWVSPGVRRRGHLARLMSPWIAAWERALASIDPSAGLSPPPSCRLAKESWRSRLE